MSHAQESVVRFDETDRYLGELLIGSPFLPSGAQPERRMSTRNPLFVNHGDFPGTRGRESLNNCVPGASAYSNTA